MKKLASILIIICLGLHTQAQDVPKAFSYQAVALDNKGAPIANDDVVVEISIFKSSATGTLEWQEVHHPTTNEHGQFSVAIGKGTSTLAGAQNSFADINWAEGPYFLRTRVDFGTSEVINSLIDMGTVQLQSVPYALLAESALNAPTPKLSDLTDVDASTVQDGQVLKWTGTQWLSSDAIDGNLFVRTDGTSDLTGDWTISSNSITLTSGSLNLINGVVTTPNLSLGGTKVDGITIDPNLAAVSHSTLASSQALKSYIDGQLAGGGEGWTVTPSTVFNLNQFIGVGIEPLFKFHGNITGNAFVLEGGFQGDDLTTFQSGTSYMAFLGNRTALRVGVIDDPNLSSPWKNAGNYSFAFGKNNIAEGDYSFAFGEGNAAGEKYAVAFGTSNIAAGLNSFAVGEANETGAGVSVAFGKLNINSGDYCLTVGTANRVESSVNSFIFGDNNKLLYNGPAAGPDPSISIPRNCLIGGLNSSSKSRYTFVYGENVQLGANSIGTVAMGKNINTDVPSAFAFGEGITLSSIYQIVVGRYNMPTASAPKDKKNWDANDELFTVGNGTDIGTPSNAMVVFKNGNVEVQGTVTGGIASPSDRRLKKEIKPLEKALQNITKLEGVSYYWDKTKKRTKNMSDEKQLGVIAQDLEKVFPELIITSSDGFKTVNYIGIIPVLIEAIKEQQKEIKELKEAKSTKEEQIDELGKKYKAMNDRLETIEKLLLKTTTK